MPIPMTSVAAAASQGAVRVHREFAARASKWAFSITCHISSSGASGTLKSSGSRRITSSKLFSSISLLLECSEGCSQLRSCRGESALARPFGDAQDPGDFRVRVSLYVVQYQRRSISV